MIQTFEFKSVDIPSFIEQVDKNSGYYKLGIDNKFYNYLMDIYKNSSNHASIVDNIIQRVVGTGFQSDNDVDKQLIDKYKLNDWFKHAARQQVLYGGFATEIIWNILHEKINEFYSCNLDRIRVGLMDDSKEEPTLYYYSSKFGEYSYNKRNMDIDVLYKFDIDPKTDAHQLMYNFGSNRIGNDIYPRPDYQAGIPWIETDIALPRYYMNLVHNNFMVSNILYVPFQPTETNKKAFEEGLKEKFVGTDNAASTLVIYGNTDGEVKLINVTGDNGEKKYDELINLACESLSRTHRLPSPMLAGISLPGNLFGISDLPQLEIMFNKQVIYPKRNALKSEFDKINKYLVQPITNYTIEDINIFNEKTN